MSSEHSRARKGAQTGRMLLLLLALPAPGAGCTFDSSGLDRKISCRNDDDCLVGYRCSSQVCSPAPPTTRVCLPNGIKDCLCLDGRTGQQHCRADGSGWLVDCDCSAEGEGEGGATGEGEGEGQEGEGEGEGQEVPPGSVLPGGACLTDTDCNSLDYGYTVCFWGICAPYADVQVCPHHFRDLGEFCLPPCGGDLPCAGDCDSHGSCVPTGALPCDPYSASYCARSSDCHGAAVEPCPGGKWRGTCQTGFRMCRFGAWGACTDAVDPVPETCDGEDNDCNGKVDDGGLCLQGYHCNKQGKCVPNN